MIEHPWRLVVFVVFWFIYLAAILTAFIVLPVMPADWRVF